MATGVNVKMGVSGISQFKQNISAAKNSLKTLDAQLALNEKQYKANGDAEAYMQEKSNLLKLKLEEQKSIIANTENALKNMADNGIDKSSKSFQDMQQQLLKAKGDLLDTESAMQGIAEEGDEAASGVDSMNQQLRRIGDGVNYENVTNGLGKITDGLEKVISKAWRAGKALINNTMGAAAWADDLMTRANQWGISTTKLQQMDQVADLVDTDTDTILGAQDKLVKGINSGDKDIMGLFASKNLDPTRLKATKDGIETLFWEAGDSLMHMTNEAERDQYALKMFGKSWRDLEPLFKTGRTEYNNMLQAQHTVSEEQLENLSKMDDAVQKLNNEWEIFKTTILSALAEGLTPALEVLNGLMSQFNEYLASPEGKEMLHGLAEAVKGLFSNLSSIDPQQVIEGFAGVFKSITDGLQWVQEHSGDVVTAMGAIVAGWGMLKLTGGALDILKLVNGLQWLHKNPNISLPGTAAGGGTEAAGAAAATGGKLAALAGVAIPAGFMAAFAWAANQRINNPYIRGGEGAIDQALASDDLQDAFAEWIESNRLLQEAMDKGIFDDEALIERANKANERLYGMEGGAEAAQAYSDWRQWNMMGNTDWRMPTGEQWENLTASMNRMSSEAGDLTGEQAQTRKANELMTDAAEGLMSLPADVRAAVVEGLSGINIYIDGQQAGAALSPYVANNMGGMVMRLMVPQ